MDWHTAEIKDLMHKFESSKKGLSEADAGRHFQEYGPNQLKQERRETIWHIFFNQFKDILIIILIIASVIAAIAGHTIDAVVIGFILILNAVLGTIQESKAEKALDALKKLAALKSKVIRNGVEKIIDSAQLVPGDIIVLEEGRQVPADSRLIEAHNLQVDESALTGESVPVSKEDRILKKEVPIAEMKNMVFMGTYCSRGAGLAVVTGTGSDTEMGKIAKQVQIEEKEMSPLQQKLERMGKTLTVIVLIIVALIFVVGLYRHSLSVLELFLISV